MKGDLRTLPDGRTVVSTGSNELVEGGWLCHAHFKDLLPIRIQPYPGWISQGKPVAYYGPARTDFLAHGCYHPSDVKGDRCCDDIPLRDGEVYILEEESVGDAGGFDMVERPEHYMKENGRETINSIRDILGEEGFIAYCRGTAIKYLSRYGKKDDPAQEIAKARKYLEFALNVLDGKDPSPEAA